jgi:hypothetical protein
VERIAETVIGTEQVQRAHDRAHLLAADTAHQPINSS